MASKNAAVTSRMHSAHITTTNKCTFSRAVLTGINITHQNENSRSNYTTKYEYKYLLWCPTNDGKALKALLHNNQQQQPPFCGHYMGQSAFVGTST